jgi:hypothetical protein
MTLRPHDPLLTAARFVISLLLALLAIVAAGLLLGAPAVLIFKPQMLAALSRHSGQAIGPDTIVAICWDMVLIAGMAGLAFQFLLQLRRIIDSVALGDSFARVNARRLTQMGWLTVAIQVLSIPAGALAVWVDTIVRGGGRPQLGLSLGGILMALLLFILARVFREGARMREDLEGTV